ncbi:MAG: hypothetical protein CFE45_33990 [Burkholderiales bacterium PBB5]|nr:MAG: hypothetical protein CFE45_33990 [Burkholderiales bacterium PBB5]
MTASTPHRQPDDLLVIDTGRLPPQPWRNGGGSTRELLTWPEGADWRLRVSLADISQDGPFSAFPGVDRWFAVVQGAGVRLALPGGPVKVTADSPPLAFDGADAPGCTLLDGPTRDLNLMCHRSAGQGLMQRAVADVPWTTDTPYRCLFTTGGCTLLIDGHEAAELAPMALIFSELGAHQAWTLRQTGAPLQAWWMAFSPLPDAPVA